MQWQGVTYDTVEFIALIVVVLILISIARSL